MAATAHVVPPDPSRCLFALIDKCVCLGGLTHPPTNPHTSDVVMDGSGTDTISSAIFLGGTDLIQKVQVFRGTASGSGTRSGTTFPISAIVNNSTTATRTITVAILFSTTFDNNSPLNRATARVAYTATSNRVIL